MLVSELRGSLSDLQCSIKTYSFLPPDDFQVLPGLLSSSTLPSEGEEDFRRGVSARSFTAHSHTVSLDEGSLMEPSSATGDLDNFASGIIDTFESNLMKLHYEDRSHSLPDVFSASQLCNGVSSADDSSTSISTSSVLDHSKESFLSEGVAEGVVSGDDKTTYQNGHQVLNTGLLTPTTSDSAHSEAAVSTLLAASGGGCEWAELGGESEGVFGVTLRQRQCKDSIASSSGDPATYSEVFEDREETEEMEGSLK